ncbi:hypothetical protein HY641_00550 [Candidatus Woesearchaeota archaeon]|nr:hypothetical protein [Candidatus Woesearchaeota archaeon]
MNITFLNYPPFSHLGQDIMTQLLQNHIEIVQTFHAIKLATGHVVSRCSPGHLDPSGLVAYARQFEGASNFDRPFSQTGDLAVIVRDELDKNPLIVNGEPDLDGSDCFQRLSDIGLFYVNKKGRLTMVVSDLPTMYPGNLEKQFEVAKRIGWGIEIDLTDALVTDINENAGSRKADIKDNHYPFVVPTSKYGRNRMVKAVFPKQAERNAQYLDRKGCTEGMFFLLGSHILKSFMRRKNGLVRFFGLGGNDNYDIGTVNASVDFYGFGWGRAGSVDAKNSP